MGIRLASQPHPLEIFRPGQSKTSLHPHLNMRRNSLPTSPLDVFVGFDSEFVAPLKAAAFEDCTSVGRGHALAETMHAHAAADLGLVCSFGHATFFLYFSKKMITPSLMGCMFLG